MTADTLHLITLLCEQADRTASALDSNRDRLRQAKLPGFAVDAHDLRDLARQVRSALEAETRGWGTPE